MTREIQTPEQAWARLAGDQTIEEWDEFAHGPTDLEFLHDYLGEQFPELAGVGQYAERQRLGELMLNYIDEQKRQD